MNRRRFLSFLGLGAIAGPAAAAPAFVEAQSPGAVNDAARAAMARFAEFRDDVWIVPRRGGEDPFAPIQLIVRPGDNPFAPIKIEG